MSDDASPLPSGRQKAIRDLEEQLSLLWRRGRANGNKVAKQVHPDMEPGAYGLLAALQRKGPLRLTDLAAEIGVGKPTVSRQVAMLESLGVVRKQADPWDRRAQTITLTEDGLRQLTAAQAARQRVFHDVLSAWDVRDVADLASLLAKLNEAYRQEPH